MAEFAYNNAKHASTGYIPFELNCRYHLRISYKEDVNSRSRSKAADKLTEELKNLLAACRENVQHVQELQKKAHNKRTKPRSYATGEKVWLSSKYIKTKSNWKLKAKFFGLFRALHLVSSQSYKLKLPKRWRIHDVFHLSLLEQDTKKKGWADENKAEQLKFEVGGDNKKYEVEGICDSAVYAGESEVGHLLGLYYLVSWKGYPKNKSTWEPASAVQHLRKMVNTFYKNNPNKPIATSPPIDLAPLMANCTIPPNVNDKRKRSQLVVSVRKKAKH